MAIKRIQMKSISSLSLSEKFIIIAHHANKGRFFVSDIVLNHGIVGSLLLELSLNELVYLNNNKLVVKTKKTKDALLSELLDKISDTSREKTVKTWVRRLNNKSKKYRWRILNTLNDKKIMRIERRKFIGLIPYKLTYFTDGKIRETLIENIRDTVLNSKKVSKEDVAFLSLMQACKMQKVFCANRSECREFNKNLKELLDNNPITDAVAKSIKEVQAAVMGVVAGAAAASAVTSSN